MQRYITTNAAARIPEEIQICLWNLIDGMEEERDYLQIFKLSEWNGIQFVLHSQEVPAWSETALIATDSPVTEKVYIIEENGIQTMMLAEDY